MINELGIEGAQEDPAYQGGWTRWFVVVPSSLITCSVILCRQQ